MPSENEKGGGFLCFVLICCVIVPAFLIISAISAAVSTTTGSSSVSVCRMPLRGRSSTFLQFATATDARECSCVGRKILNREGSTAVDAAIASLLCVGIVNMHSTGIGGGGIMVHYKNYTKEVTVIDFRESAPTGFSMAVTKDNRDLLKLGTFVGHQYS